MSPGSRESLLVLAGCGLFACAHPRAQQTEAQPQATARPQAAATATPAPAAVDAGAQATPVASASASTAGVPAAASDAVTLAASAGGAAADFAHDVRPILEKHCQPCHFEGGKMYDRLPFDRAETIQRLGTRLFTRIKAEDEQVVIRRFLAQGS